jgi:hypothetical protein
MAASNGIDITKGPFSGDVSQSILPWTWMGNFGYINVNQTVSSNRALEREITQRVAGYGRQIGRVSEALEVVLAQMPPGRLPDKQQRALDDFRDMMRGIAAVKAGYAAPTQENVDRFIAGLRFLRRSDEAAFQNVAKRLRTEVLEDPDARPALPALPRPRRTR